MKELYKHFWIDPNDGKTFMQEGCPAGEVIASIKDYRQESGAFPYSYTLIWDEKNATCRTINIEELIKEMKLLSEKMAAEEDQERRENIAYFSWAQAGGSNH